MFHEVRISDSNGKLKKTISRAELSKAFWKKIYEEEDKGITSSKKISNPGIRRRLKEIYPHLYDLTPSFNF